MPNGAEPAPHRITRVGPRTWFVQPSWVNVSVFETDAGLVMIDHAFGLRGFSQAG